SKSKASTRTSPAAEPRAQKGSAAAKGAAKKAAETGATVAKKGGGNLLGKVAKGAKGLGKKIPGIGALLSLGFMAKEIHDSETSDGTRAEKDVSTGKAVGAGLGAMGGMTAGASAGAMIGTMIFPGVGTVIGGAVGAAAGAWMGDEAGSVIGEQFGSWVSDLRGSDFVQGMSDSWHEMTLFTGDLWGKVSATAGEQWTSVTAAVGTAWDTASTAVSSTWTRVSTTVSAAWIASADKLSAAWNTISTTITDTWISAVGVMSSAWTTVTDKLSGIWDSVANIGSKANDWIAEKTGVDVAATVDSAGNFVSNAWDSTKNAVGNAVSTVGEKTGISGAIRAVKGSVNYAKGRSSLEKQMAIDGITDPTEAALFMGQMDHESAGFSKLEEGFHYSTNAGLMGTSDFVNKKGVAAAQAARDKGPEAVAELMYGGRMGNDKPGDGYKYRGRGYTHLTGYKNYAAASQGTGLDLVSNPDLAAAPENAAKIATWYWKSRAGEGLRKKAKKGDIRGVTEIFNGGENGL
ncbi:MAG: glycoside hydrolase family 19 protein, partial [Aeromonas sp.]